MAHLGGCVDEFDLEFLVSDSGSWLNDWFSQNEESLPGSNAAPFDHEPVVLDLPVVWEPAHWGDGLLGEIDLSGGGRLVFGSSVEIDSLVDFSSVVETVLTCSWDGESIAWEYFERSEE